MKLSINSRILLSQMAAVGKVINPKSPITILQSFLLELQGKTLTITGSDQENNVSSKLEVNEAEGSGKFCIDAKRTLDLLKVMPDNIITIELDEETMGVVIKFTNGRYDMVALKGDQYPESGIDASGESVEFKAPASMLSSGIDKVGFAVGDDDFHPQMMGIFFDVKEDGIVFVATDTRQLAKYRSTQAQPGVECSFILSTKTVGILGNMLTKENNIKVIVNPKSVKFEGENVSVQCCRIQGKYPDYNRVIPRDNSQTVTIDRNELLYALKRVSVCAPSDVNLVKMRFSPMDVVIRAQDICMNSSGMENVQCEFSGEPNTQMGFSAIYLIGIVNTIPTSKVVMKLGGSSRPALILPSENEEHGELTLLCMPVHIQEE